MTRLCASPATLARHRAQRPVPPLVPNEVLRDLAELATVRAENVELRAEVAEANAIAADLRNALAGKIAALVTAQGIASEVNTENARLRAVIAEMAKTKPGAAAYGDAEGMGLTFAEARVYACLRRATGPVRAFDLARDASKPTHEISKSSVSALISNIRRKLALHGAPWAIKATYGRGYLLTPLAAAQ